MFLRTFLIALAFFGTAAAARAQTFGALRDVASTNTAGVHAPRTVTAEVICHVGWQGARSGYRVSVLDGVCGAGSRSATCQSYTPSPSFAQATCDLGCRPTTGSGQCAPFTVHTHRGVRP